MVFPFSDVPNVGLSISKSILDKKRNWIFMLKNYQWPASHLGSILHRSCWSLRLRVARLSMCQRMSLLDYLHKLSTRLGRLFEFDQKRRPSAPQSVHLWHWVNAYLTRAQPRSAHRWGEHLSLLGKKIPPFSKLHKSKIALTISGNDILFHEWEASMRASPCCRNASLTIFIFSGFVSVLVTHEVPPEGPCEIPGILLSDSAVRRFHLCSAQKVQLYSRRARVVYLSHERRSADK